MNLLATYFLLILFLVSGILIGSFPKKEEEKVVKTNAWKS